ncbi:hypothetical protein FFLO_01111 [Filobasidium floriforme]|uniref:Conidiation-specific protein 6 n=1 Tax=Filobasidium floriforme TaxID=5210 RepID=A0A8K0JQJ6_9TREE|nr:uncharacterized protein HD553DRAFT_306864 [Filobasidium floriforme]KAG7570913.1 hypothetical protein FFLO_01111 [Filobasidium floriforme]KAH8087914.1 hypothetical protein HD553DRAFT_306864 [Filobasidium floriforme]
MSEHSDNRVLGGYKATLSNPNTSDEAKEHAQEMIDEMTGKSQSAGHQKRQHVDHEKGSHETDDEHNNRVIGGYRATLNNPRTSDSAKEHAQAMIDELTGVPSKPSGGNKKAHGKHDKETDDEHAHRIIGGHKANLNNPNTSEASKEHSREVLEEYGVVLK